MSIPKIVLLALIGASVLVTVSQIGKPRRTLDPSTAVASLILSGIMAWLVVIS